MSTTDLIFWYTGGVIWAILGVVLFLAPLIAVIIASLWSHHATVKYWWEWVVLAKLREVYKLDPESLRGALQSVAPHALTMATIRDVVSVIDEKKARQEGNWSWSKGCKWWVEDGKYLSLCGVIRPKDCGEVFDNLSYCQGCGLPITLCDPKPNEATP